MSVSPRCLQQIPVARASPKPTIMEQTLGSSRIMPDCLEGETWKFQSITRHLYSIIPQGILAQVHSDQALIASKGRQEFCTTERRDSTSPQPTGKTHKFIHSFNQCLLMPSYMPGAHLGVVLCQGRFGYLGSFVVYYEF